MIMLPSKCSYIQNITPHHLKYGGWSSGPFYLYFATLYFIEKPGLVTAVMMAPIDGGTQKSVAGFTYTQSNVM